MDRTVTCVMKDVLEYMVLDVGKGMHLYAAYVIFLMIYNRHVDI